MTTGVLDAAWIAAESALPEGWRLWVGRGASGYTARADRGKEAPGKSIFAHGASPAEALTKLFRILVDLNA